MTKKKKKKSKIDINDIKTWLNKVRLKTLTNGNIPLDIFESQEYRNFIRDFNNNLDVSILYDKHMNFLEGEYDNYDSFLRTLRTDLFQKTKGIIFIYDDYKYLVKRFKFNIKKIDKKIIKKKRSEDERCAKEVENSRIYDLSTGIFSPTDASGRALFKQLTFKYSNEYQKLLIERHHIINTFYSYFFIKIEQLLWFCLEFTKKHDKKRWFMLDKVKEIQKCKLFSDVKFDDEKFNELNMLWINFKHPKTIQTILKKNSYKEEKYYGYIDFITNLFEDVSKLFNFSIVNGKIDRLFNMLENDWNPLGLTGFEVD